MITPQTGILIYIPYRTVAYLDHDALHRLSAIDPSTLVSLNPNLDLSSAHSASEFIQRILACIVRNRQSDVTSETHSKRQEQTPSSIYNPITNELPSRIVHKQADAPFPVRKNGRSWMVTFGQTVRFSSDNITRRKLNRRSLSDDATIVSMEHLIDKARSSNATQLSFVNHQGTLVSRFRTSNTRVISAIIKSLQHLLLALYVSLAHIGIRLRVSSSKKKISINRSRVTGPH